MKTKITSRVALFGLIIMAFAAPISHALNATDIIDEHIYESNLGFSAIFPPGWEDANTTAIEVELSGIGAVPGVDIGRSLNPAAITITQYTIEQWNDLMAMDDGPTPSMLGTGKGFVLGYTINQESFNDDAQWILDHISVHSKKLSDVEGNKNAMAIQYLLDNMVISGYPDGSFKPEQNINRAELMKIITEASGAIPSPTTNNNCFPDVSDEWFAVYVCYAKNQNWIQGYPDGTFKPGNDVNKVEALKMIINSQEIDIPGAVNETPFDDADNSAWYAPFIKAANDNGMLEQTDGIYGVDELITRGEVSENIYRALLIASIENFENDGGSRTTPDTPETAEEIAASIDGYAVFSSDTYNFSIEYPDQWFYEGLAGENNARLYHFGPELDEEEDPLVILEISSNEAPDGTVVEMNEKDLVLIVEGEMSNIYYVGETTGRLFRLYGGSEFEDAMLNMGSSILDQAPEEENGS